MFAIAQAPAKQTATETIHILSGRLQSATLLEDRRNAILGLRSFARQYPASVASGALRGLIGSLSKDVEDVDTLKVVLETLLMLFNPDTDSPEASEEIALWLADEFTQRQENITFLLDLLETTEFYSRMYSLQLLSAILSSRTERTEECIFTAPLGISRLVAILDERREIIRNEGLSLLTFLTPSSAELQKMVAFENAFERIFAIIKLEGSLSLGDRVVEDCLILLANLLRMNISNQSFFRETGGVAQIALLLKDVVTEQEKGEEVAEWAQTQKNRNIYALLAVIRLFLVRGGLGARANQGAFWQHKVTHHVLQLAFSHSTEIQIRAEALVTCADLIRGHTDLQAQFPHLQVTSALAPPSTEANGTTPKQNGAVKVSVIEGLLELMLNVPSHQSFDARLGACECLQAYIYNHPMTKKHFLEQAIRIHLSGTEDSMNVLTTLLRPATEGISSDPYRYWFAAVIVYHLIFEDGEAKATAMAVTEGDASSGEEVVTCIQMVAANLISSIQKNDDDRVVAGYLMLLCGWLFEDPDGVNDFLGEGSNVEGLVQAVLQGDRGSALVQGLCAMLLGIVYEFSTKDSPVPRVTLHSILVSRMGQEQYIDRLGKLRRHPFVRDYEVLPQRLSSAEAGGLPLVFFDRAFVDFAKDNFSRLLRAFDRDPGMEISVITNGVQKGISRELVDSLRSQLEEKENHLQKAQSDLVSQERQLGQERSDSRKAKETAALELSRIKGVNEALQRHHEGDLSNLRAEHAGELDALRAQHKREIADLQRQIAHVQRTSEGEADRIRRRNEAESSDFKKTVASLEARLEKANKDHLKDLQTAVEEHTTKVDALSARLERAEDKAKDAETSSMTSQSRLKETEVALAAKEELRATAQSELDDLLMVFGDLEDKVARYKERLKTLGETVSDGEDEDEEDDGEEDEEDEEDEDEDDEAASGVD